MTELPKNRTGIAFDYERYAEHLADLDLTEEEARQVLSTLWDIMVQFVDLGFGIHPVQQSCGQDEHTSIPHDDSYDHVVSCKHKDSAPSTHLDLTSYFLCEENENAEKGGDS